MHVPASVLLWRFRTQAPSLYMDARYATRDHVIPFRLFCLYLEHALPAEDARQRLNQAQATMHALSYLFRKEKGASSTTRSELRAAYLAGDPPDEET